MGYRYEFEDVEPTVLQEICHDIDECFVGDYPLEAHKCTIYDEDTDEELAHGFGNSEDDARWAAERNL